MLTGNEPSMPIFLQDGLTNNSHVDLGLTIRQHFAVMAMQGMCTNSILPHWSGEMIAEYAVKYADALITELNKQP